MTTEEQIEEILDQFLLDITSKKPDVVKDFKRQINKLLIEARIDENAKMSQRYFNHSERAFNADGDEFQAVACGQITHEHNKRKSKLTAQFNSKGNNDEYTQL